MRRLIPVILFVATVGLVSLAGTLFYWAQRTLPPSAGTYVTPGLQAPVEIFRDDDGIPFIFADNREDAALGLGFVHAQDRLWQMESMRRLGHGRLAEAVGQAGIASDRLMRTLGIGDLARRQAAVLSPETRQLLDRYAAGVNAWIERHRGALPPEFVLLGVEPEPWSPPDSLVWARIMAMRISGNWRDELIRARMTTRLSNEQLLTFWYPDGTDRAGGIEDLGQVDATINDSLPLERLAGMFPAPPSQPVGASNAWAIRRPAGALLANDPHLGFSLPVLWYLADVTTPYAHLRGATVPGVPFHILGQNDDIAWGMTTTQSDQQDVFIERISDDGARYQAADGTWQPLTLRNETIKVAGAPDVVLRVRSTGRGPIISDLVDPVPGVVGDGYALSLAAAYLADDDRTPDAMLGINRADNWQSFRRALADFHTPQQNIVFADQAGNIGFFAPGRVPVRRIGRGRMPTPGWTSGGDWVGWIPYDELPVAFNPRRGRIVSANNQIVSPDYPHFLTDDWAPNYRAKRIFELLDGTSQADLAAMMTMQQDVVSTMARDLLPIMTSIAPDNPRTAEAVELLARWDGVMRRDAREPLVFYGWLMVLQRMLTHDELGPLSAQSGGVRPRFLARIFSGSNDADRAWCDDITTPAVETCDQLLERSLTTALLELARDRGNGEAEEPWGARHKATFVNSVLAAIPGVGDKLGRREIPADGGNYTINRAAMRSSDAANPFADIHGPGYRAIYDLSDPGRSRFMIATGQSGNPFSVNYANMIEPWRDGAYRAMSRSRSSFVSAGVTPLRLLPESSQIKAPSPTIPLLDRFMLHLARFVRAWTGLLA